jgi:hypothetical protein
VNKAIVAVCALAAVLAALSVGAVRPSLSTSRTVDWWVLSGGGAPAMTGRVTLNGSLGQIAIGPSARADVELDAGYWTVARPERPPDQFIFLPVALRDS